MQHANYETEYQLIIVALLLKNKRSSFRSEMDRMFII
jgi:hypothetical protein